MNWKNSVCMATSTATGFAAVDYVEHMTEAEASAIDGFYSATSDILTKVTPEYFDNNSSYITGLLFIGLISAVENYFRDILGFILSVCPISQSTAAEEKVQLGSMLWSSGNAHSKSAFEFMAFSASDNITKTFAKFTGYQVKSGFGWHQALMDYDQLCELRHGIVHSGHVISGKNAIRLGLGKTSDKIKVTVNYANLQTAGAVCTNLVQAANNELFELVVTRWTGKWRGLPSWDASLQDAIFVKIWSAFYSRRDGENGSITNAVDLNSCLLRVKQEFNL